jgi:hypothetical protein
VLRRQALVAEVAVDLVHALEPADHEAFEVQLGRDPQVHVEIEGVVMGAERTRGGPARDRLHHRRLDLEEVERVEEVAQVAHDAGAGAEHVAARLAHDQVEVATPVARLGVGEAVPFVGQWPQRLHDEAQIIGAHRQLAGLGAEEHPARAQDVPDVEALEGLVALPERLLLQVKLNLPGAVGDLREARLAHDALEHQPPADPDARRVGLEPFPALRVEGLVQLPGERIAPEVIGIRPAARPAASQAQLRELGAPLGDQLVLVEAPIRGVGVAGVGHGLRAVGLQRPAFSEASRNWSRSPSRTAVVLPTSTPVRRSLIRDWSST